MNTTKTLPKILREYIAEAGQKKVALGHFNISNLEGLHAAFAVAREMNVPVIIGLSEGEREFVGVHEAAALVKTLRDTYNYPIFLNADHSYSFEKVKEAIDAGFDMVIFDGTKLPMEENITLTKQCVDYARHYSVASGRDVLVEAELGYIGQSSKILDEVPDDLIKTTPEQAKEFVDATGIDMLAPAVGNIHGMLRSGMDPELDIDLIAKISQTVGIPLVLHGGSGNSDEDFQAAIVSGVRIIHINTELRVAYKTALKMSLEQNPDEVAPYKILAGTVSAMKAVVENKLKVFNNFNKI